MSETTLFLIVLTCICVKTIGCDESADCYTQPAESCPLQNECKCVKTDETSLFCCWLQSEEDLLKNFQCPGVSLSSVKALHIYNMTADNFNFAILPPQLSHLISFSLTNSSINRLYGRIEHAPQILCLNFSNTVFGSEWQDPQAIDNIKHLAMLDFSNVNITRLPIFTIQNKHFWLDISSNTKLNCQFLLDFMKSTKKSENILHFKKPSDTYCMSTQSFHWFNSTEKVPLDQIEDIRKLDEDCPEFCVCKWHSLEIMPNSLPKHTIQVDCSNKQLLYLPENLPENTVLLNVTNNNITNLDALTTDDTYKTLREFHADDNKISNIISLEGSHFIDNYSKLSLKLNNLKLIPTYILQNSFIRGDIGGHTVFLGGNQLQCDCSTALSLKVWLLTNRAHIPDYADIVCDNLPYKLKVIDLEEKLVCVTEADWTHYMYYVIFAEVSLLLLLIGKVSYDYWVFKTAGYLPWPASKMPKLPCDWVFE